MTVAEGGGRRAVTHKLRDMYVPTLKANFMVWPAVQILNFRVLPIQFQVVSNLVPFYPFATTLKLTLHLSHLSQVSELHGLHIFLSQTLQKMLWSLSPPPNPHASTFEKTSLTIVNSFLMKRENGQLHSIAVIGNERGVKGYAWGLLAGGPGGVKGRICFSALRTGYHLTACRLCYKPAVAHLQINEFMNLLI
jgi:hypothetical protein